MPPTCLATPSLLIQQRSASGPTDSQAFLTGNAIVLLDGITRMPTRSPHCFACMPFRTAFLQAVHGCACDPPTSTKVETSMREKWNLAVVSEVVKPHGALLSLSFTLF